MVHMHTDMWNVRCLLNDRGIVLSRGRKSPSLPAEPSEQEMAIETLISQQFIAGFQGRARPCYIAHLDLSDHQIFVSLVAIFTVEITTICVLVYTS